MDRLNFRKKMAVFISLVMILQIVIGNVGFAANGSIEFDKTNLQSFANGELTYKNGVKVKCTGLTASYEATNPTEVSEFENLTSDVQQNYHFEASVTDSISIEVVVPTEEVDNNFIGLDIAGTTYNKGDNIEELGEIKYSFQYTYSESKSQSISVVLKYNNQTSQTVESRDVGINIKNSQNGKVLYQIDGTGKWEEVTSNSFTLRKEIELKDVTDTTKIYIKVEPNSEQSIDTNDKQNCISIEDENQEKSETNISADELEAGSYNFIYVSTKKYNIQIAFNGGSNPPAVDYPNDITINFATTDLSPLAEVAINDQKFSPGDNNLNSLIVAKGYSEGENKNVIRISPEFGGKFIDTVTINGTSYNNYIDEHGILEVELAAVGTYNIELTYSEGNDITIVWAYDLQKFWGYDAQNQEDTLVENGKVKLVSIKRKGENKEEQIIYMSDNDITDVNQEGIRIDDNGGFVALKKGDDVVLKLIPDYGYQLKSATINDSTLTPQTGTSTFELKNIQGNLHFSGAFVNTKDTVEKTSNNISTATISNGQEAIDSGNLNMKVSDNNNYSTDATSAVRGPTSVEKVASIDILLEQKVSKGIEGQYWTNSLTDLAGPVNVEITPTDTTLLPGEQFSVVRDHNGTLTELVTTYNSLTNELTFATDQFSTYTIVKKVVTAPVNPSVNPPASIPDPTPAPTLAPTEEAKPSMAPVSEEVTTSVSKEVESVVKEIVKGTDTTVVDEDTASKIKEAAEQGKEINTEVVAETVEKEKVDLQEVKAIEEKVKSLQSVVDNINNTIKKITSVAQFINVEILIKADGEKLGNLKELKEPIKLEIEIPDNLKKSSRKFFVVRLHDGIVEKLESIMNDDGTLTFITDKFSTYALAYEDTVEVEKKVGKTNIGSTTRTSTSVTIPWSKVAGATKYRVYYKEKGTSKYLFVKDTTPLKYTIKGLKPATTYTFAVKAYGYGKWSDVYATKITTTAPSKVSTPIVKTNSKGKVTISYSKVVRATGYEIYMAKGNGKYVKVKTTTANSYTRTKLTRGATYKFKVRAYKKVGSNVYYGAYSSAKVVKAK